MASLVSLAQPISVALRSRPNVFTHMPPTVAAIDAEHGPLTLVAAPTMLSAVRIAEELPQDPRTAAVFRPRGGTA
jgi:hypothetical protein